MNFESFIYSDSLAIAVMQVRNKLVMDVNQAWEKLTGFSREEIVGKTHEELLLWLEPGQGDELIRLLGRSKKITLDVKLRCKSGLLREIPISAELVTLGDERYLVLMAHDAEAPG